jgi:hypothetical protein
MMHSTMFMRTYYDGHVDGGSAALHASAAVAAAAVRVVINHQPG